MSIKFASDEWIKALGTELNRSETYRAAAKDWEGDFYFVVNNGSAPEDIYLYMDLWHGECRAAYGVTRPEALSPEFTIEASLPTWRKVVEKKLDPIQGLLMRQLKLKGPMLKVMRAPKAATELVHCCTQIETDWPEEQG